MVHELFKILSVVAVSSVKFIGGPLLAYKYHFNFMEMVVYTAIGGMTGVVVVTYATNWMIIFWHWLRHHYSGKSQSTYSLPTVDLKGNIRISYIYISKTAPAIFTKRNRTLVSLWVKYGLVGIALVTPIFLSIPIGTFFATRFSSNREKVFLYMFASVLIWSLVITAILYKLVPISAHYIVSL